MKHILLIIFLLIAFSFGCTSGDTWKHPAGYDRKRLGEDAKECKAYARNVTNEQRKAFRVPAGTPHGGVAEAFIIFIVFQDAFMECMNMKGWVYTEAKPSAFSK